MISFETLASGSAGNAYVVRSGSLPPLLIDAGIRYGDLQRAMNFKNHELAGCLLTHSHGDHSKCVPMLMANGTDVYASDETWTELVESGKLKARNSRTRSVGSVLFMVGPWLIQPFQAVHDSPGTLGFIVITPEDDRLVFATDTAYIKHLFEPFGVLAIECNHSVALLRQSVEKGTIDADRYVRTTKNHMSLERVLEFLSKNDLSKCREVFLMHLSSDNSDAPAFKLAVERATGIPTTICAK